MTKSGSFGGRCKYSDRIGMHAARHHREEYSINIAPPIPVKVSKAARDVISDDDNNSFPKRDFS